MRQDVHPRADTIREWCLPPVDPGAQRLACAEENLRIGDTALSLRTLHYGVVGCKLAPLPSQRCKTAARLESGVVKEDTQPDWVAPRHSDGPAHFAPRAGQINRDAAPVNSLRPGYLQQRSQQPWVPDHAAA